MKNGEMISETDVISHSYEACGTSLRNSIINNYHCIIINVIILLKGTLTNNKIIFQRRPRLSNAGCEVFEGHLHGLAVAHQDHRAAG